MVIVWEQFYFDFLYEEILTITWVFLPLYANDCSTFLFVSFDICTTI